MSKYVAWFMQSQLLLFQPAKVISLYENQPVKTIHSVSPWEGTNFTSGHHKLRKPPACFKTFPETRCPCPGEKSESLHRTDSERTEWDLHAPQAPKCAYTAPLLILVVFQDMLSKYLICLTNMSWNVCCGPGALPGVQRWNRVLPSESYQFSGKTDQQTENSI